METGRGHLFDWKLEKGRTFSLSSEDETEGSFVCQNRVVCRCILSQETGIQKFVL